MRKSAALRGHHTLKHPVTGKEKTVNDWIEFTGYSRGHWFRKARELGTDDPELFTTVAQNDAKRMQKRSAKAPPKTNYQAVDRMLSHCRKPKTNARKFKRMNKTEFKRMVNAWPE